MCYISPLWSNIRHVSNQIPVFLPCAIIQSDESFAEHVFRKQAIGKFLYKEERDGYCFARWVLRFQTGHIPWSKSDAVKFSRECVSEARKWPQSREVEPAARTSNERGKSLCNLDLATLPSHRWMNATLATARVRTAS